MLQTFLLQLRNNNTISLFDTGATISCMSKACFDKLQPKPTLVQTHTYKVKWFQWQQSWSSQNHYMYPQIPYKISTAIYSFANTSFTLSF